MGSDARAAPEPHLRPEHTPERSPEPSPEQAQSSSGFEHALMAVARRVRTQRALEAACTFSVAALGIAALGVSLLKTQHATAAHACLLVALCTPLLGALLGVARPLPSLLPARLLDHAARTPDLIASAWSFARLPADSRTPFMQACLARAGVHAQRVSVAAAFPLHAPRALRPAFVLGVALLALSALELQRPAPVVARAVAKPRLLHEEDLSAVAAELSAMEALAGDDPALRTAMAELNALLEALHDGELDRLAALRELRALEERLALQTAAEDDSALREALRGLGKAIGDDSPARDLAAALAQADAEKARAEAERLAALLAAQPPAKPAAQQLARALERAGKRKPDDGAAERQRLKDEVDRLLKKKQQGEGLSEREQRLLERKQRELDKLEREQQQREQAQRQLDQLERELGASGGALGQGQQQSASQHMQQGARELQRMAQQQLSKEQREKLKQSLQQLRETISKQQSGQQQSGQQQQAQAGQGNGQRLDLSRFGKLARGQQGSQPGNGKGQQPGQGQPQAMMLGKPGDGEPQALIEGDGEGSGAQRLQLEGSAISGSNAGQGGRPQQLPAPSELDSKRVDTRVEGALGAGPSRSQVIREAGQRGFASRGYEQVHADYNRHAEAVLERDQVPGGYRFYVRRYFQLIRPRNAAPPRSAGAVPRQETHD